MFILYTEQIATPIEQGVVYLILLYLLLRIHKRFTTIRLEQFARCHQINDKQIYL